MLAVAGTAACRTPSLEQGELRVHLDGDAALEVATRDGRFAAVDDGSVISQGATIRGRAGEPRLELVDGSQIIVGRDARLEFGRTLRLDEGEVLVKSSRPATIATPLTTIRSSGLTRVGQALATTVRVYEGKATVTSHGRSLGVPALRQTAVADGGLVPRLPTPITWRSGDLWDERFLAPIIELTDQLDGQARGFGRQASSASASDIASLVGLPGSALVSEVRNRPSGETLIGGALVAAGAHDADGVFELRDAGAAWGVVAVEQVADPSKAVSIARGAIERWLQRSRATVAASASAGSGDELARADGPPAPAGPTPTTTPSPPPTAPEQESPSVTLPPATVPPVTVAPLPEPVTTAVPTVADTVGQVLGGAVDLLAGG